jgi:tartrate-resistant acid phosphatase type 5
MAASYKNSMALSLLFAITFGLCFFFTSAELQRFEHPTKIDGSLSFLVLGDWGRRGAFNQSEVAHQVINLVFFFFFFQCFE